MTNINRQLRVSLSALVSGAALVVSACGGARGTEGTTGDSPVTSGGSSAKSSGTVTNARSSSSVSPMSNGGASSHDNASSTTSAATGSGGAAASSSKPRTTTGAISASGGTGADVSGAKSSSSTSAQSAADGGADGDVGGQGIKGDAGSVGATRSVGGRSNTGRSSTGGAETSRATSSGVGGGRATTANGSGGEAVGGGSADAPSTSPGCGATDPLKSGRASIDVSGSKREYILKVPDSYNASKPYKLIFAFHWKGGSANDVATGSTGGGPYYGLEQRAGGNAILVAPEGLEAGFANTNGRDIAFVRAMLSLFGSKLCIDQKRIFSTGFSYGGMMSDSIGCEMADVFRAIAPMAGGIPSAQHAYSGCNQANDHPIAVWMAHGDSDTVVPIADGKAALAIFLKRNQCQSQTAAVTPNPCVAYQGCSTGFPIHWCQFSGGHSTPSFASAAIWDFFNQF